MGQERTARTVGMELLEQRESKGRNDENGEDYHHGEEEVATTKIPSATELQSEAPYICKRGFAGDGVCCLQDTDSDGTPNSPSVGQCTPALGVGRCIVFSLESLFRDI